MGRIECFETHIPQLNRQRKIRVYLPEAYDTQPDKHFPAIYMHDGQNLYDGTESFGGNWWQVKETLELFEAEGKTEGIIVVGIDNDGIHRWDEYSLWMNEGVSERLVPKGTKGGEGKAYAEFVAITLKELIDHKYRTLTEKEHTAVAGSSMGGVISLAIAFLYPHIFSKIGIFSIASWFAEEPMLNYMREKALPVGQKYFITVGTEETSDHTYEAFPQVYMNCSKYLYEALLDKGVSKDQLFYEVYEGEVHNEIEWAKHFPTFVQWSYGLK